MTHPSPSLTFSLLAALVLALPGAALAAPVLMADGFSKPPATSASPAQQKVYEASAALDRQDWRAAEAAFRAAMALDSKLVIPYIGMAELAAQRGDKAGIDNWLGRALAIDPRDVDALRAQGGVQVRRGQFTEAVATFKKALQRDPRSFGTQLQLAEVYLVNLKRPAPAEAAYRAAVEIEPKDVDAQLGLAASIAAQGRFDDTVAAFEKAALLDPRSPRPPHSLARFYASQTKFDAALAALDRALLIAPDYLPAHLDRGDLLLASNQPEKALAAFASAAGAVKDPAPLQFRRAVTLQGLQRWDEAEKAYLDALKSDPKMFAAYNNLAFMAASRKVKLDDALLWSRKALELAPANTALQDTLGWVHYVRGEYEPAVTAIKKALAADPRQPNYHYHLGVVYSAQGKRPLAAASLRKALELSKTFRNAADAQARLQQLGS